MALLIDPVVAATVPRLKAEKTRSRTTHGRCSTIKVQMIVDRNSRSWARRPERSPIDVPPMILPNASVNSLSTRPGVLARSAHAVDAIDLDPQQQPRLVSSAIPLVGTAGVA